MTAPRQQQQVIEFLEQLFRPSFLVAQLFALTPRDLPLDAILVKTSDDLVTAASEIQAVNNCIITVC